MAQVVQATCPGCKGVLRIPSDWVSKPIRCKNCGAVMKAKAPAADKTPSPKPRQSPPPVDAPVSAVKPVAGPSSPPVARSVPAPAAVAAPQAFDFDEPAPDAEPREPRRKKKKGGAGWIGLAVLGFVVLALGGVTLAFLPKIKAVVEQAAVVQPAEGKDDDPAPSPRAPRKAIAKKSASSRHKSDGDPEPKVLPASGAPFPRRALIISVHNYLYMNPIIEGPKDSLNVTRLIRSLNIGLRMPLSQIIQLTDSQQAKERRPPLKSVIEEGLTNFLKTTRKQDRIMVFFIGHTREIDNDAYLVPLEGEMEDAKTLIPLKWVYEQMAKCDARQKILVLDGNRNNTAQGEERPKSGPMGPKFEAMLKAPPAGVQVWSACSAGQESNEFEDAPLGAFLDAVRLALTPEKGTKGALEGKIQRPDDLIPIEALNENVNTRLQSEMERRKLKQVALLSGSAPKEGVAYDKNEAPAAVPALPTVTRGNQALVKEIIQEVSLPPLKGGEEAGQDVDFEVLPPFAPDAMKEFDGSMKPDDKLRQAIHDARVALWAVSTAKPPKELQGDVQAVRKKLRVDLSIMKDRYARPGAGPGETTFKTRVFNDGKEMSRIVSELEDVLEKLKEAGEEKDKAPKRWQANYTFILARLHAQLAYLEDYQSLLGQMRKEFPPSDPNINSGWRMAAKEKASDSAGKKYDKAARKLYGETVTAYKGTPWEVLGKREKLTALGLEWQAY